MENLRPFLSLIVTLMFAGCNALPLSEPWLLPKSDREVKLDLVADEFEWGDAAQRAINFTVILPDGSRTYAGMWKASASGAQLRFYVEFNDVAPNPFNNETTSYVYGIGIFLAHDQAELQIPSDVKVLSQLERFNASFLDDGYWDGSRWTFQQEGPGGDFTQDGTVLSGTHSRGATNESTLWWEFVVPRVPFYPEHDGIDVRDGGVIRTLLKFYVGGPYDATDSATPFLGPWSDAYPAGARDDSAQGWLRVEVPPP